MHKNLKIGLKTVREAKGFTQGEVAKRLGMYQHLYCNIENGKKNVTLNTLNKIAEALEVPLSVIFWFGTTEENVVEGKKFEFSMMKSKIDPYMKNLLDID